MNGLNETYTANFDNSENFHADFGEVTSILPDPYGGEYEVTPSQEQQVLETANKSMARNVVINPIPSNYGLVEWNGTVLMIS